MRIWPIKRRPETPAPLEARAEAEPDSNAELRRNSGWWARLAGDALDLQTLAESVRLAAVQVRQLDGRFYLRADDLQGASSEQSGDVERRAEEILRVLNGAARVEHGNSREVHVDAATRVHVDGRIENFVHAPAHLTARSRMSATLTVTGQQETAEPPPSVIDRLAAKGLADTNIERALRIFGRDDVDYRDLYNVFEIAEEALGAGMFADGTVTKPEVRRFKHTPQSPTVLGDAARHGRERGRQPPANPMSFDDARDLVRRILRVWLLP